MSLIPVILSGGSGTRLWPMSRTMYPKQLLSLFSEHSLLQQTILRARQVTSDHVPIIVCNQQHRFQVAEQVQQLGISNADIILEPVVRNTAPAIALAALRALQIDENVNLLVLPSDHLLKNLGVFTEAVQVALQEAGKRNLMTFGVKPDGPVTSYGYIQAKANSVSAVTRFTEKPDKELAEKYIAAGNYYWNSGIFLFKAQAYIDELAKYAPAIHEACLKAYQGMARDKDFLRIPEADFAVCPTDSIDYAVMEKTSNAKVVPLDAGWSDLGSWQSLWQAETKDQSGNVAIGDVALHNVCNSYVRSEHGLLGVVGVEDLAVIKTADAVLVTHIDHTESVKQLVDQLQAADRQEVDSHSCVYRPWGSYEIIDEHGQFKVKRITVNPGAALSLQKHHHRAEHWVVVQGTARAVCGDKQSTVAENESIFIPVGAKHRLENPGAVPLIVIEVQFGSYLGEDDIVRFEDRYGR